MHLRHKCWHYTTPVISVHTIAISLINLTGLALVVQ
jgi:hypothetical protein